MENFDSESPLVLFLNSNNFENEEQSNNVLRTATTLDEGTWLTQFPEITEDQIIFTYLNEEEVAGVENVETDISPGSQTEPSQLMPTMENSNFVITENGIVTVADLQNAPIILSEQIQTSDTTTKPDILQNSDIEKPEKTTSSEVINYNLMKKKFKWVCLYCPDRHPTRNSLITHMKWHRKIFCGICLKHVNTKNKLKKHKFLKHGIEHGTSDSIKNRDNRGEMTTSKYGRKRLVINSLELLKDDK
uniref:C2H2-type domain-containing protein n=1 Tax=Clastoptera arizonana TaxID=38151 RepID=A0A1B6CQK8_9HEMI